jgi:hypothetical protein
MKRWAALLMLLPAAAHAQLIDLQDGVWQIDVALRVDGQDYGPYSRQQCVTREDLRDPAKLFAVTTESCEYTNLRFFVDEFSFNVRCNAGIPLAGTGKVVFGDNRFTGDMTVSAQVPGGPSVESATAISGKRLGACPAN